MRLIFVNLHTDKCIVGNPKLRRTSGGRGTEKFKAQGREETMNLEDGEWLDRTALC